MPSRITYSSRRNPCVICGRVKDADCRQTADGLVFCHQNANHRAGAVEQGDDGRSWAFVGVSKDGRCGIFKPHQPLPPRAPLSVIPPIPVPTPATPGGQQIWAYSATQRVLRSTTADGKKRFTPQHLLGGVWQTGAGPDAWPLYGQVAPVTVETEGEKCTDICLSLGIPAISQPGHNHTNEAIHARYQSIKHIAQHIIYISDNDETGRRKAEKCSEQAKKAGIPFTHLPATQLYPDTPPAGSVDDFPPEILSNLPALINAVVQSQPTPSSPATGLEQARLQIQRLITDGCSGSILDARLADLTASTGHQFSTLRKLADSLLQEDDAATSADAELQQIHYDAELLEERKAFTLENYLPTACVEPLRYISTSLQSDDLCTMMIFLTCMTGALKAGTRIWGDNVSFAERPQLWLAVLGKSGLGKSPAIKNLGVNRLRAVIKDYEHRNNKRFTAWEAANAAVPKKERDPMPSTIRPFVFPLTPPAPSSSSSPPMKKNA